MCISSILGIFPLIISDFARLLFLFQYFSGENIDSNWTTFERSSKSVQKSSKSLDFFYFAAVLVTIPCGNQNLLKANRVRLQLVGIFKLW